LVIQDTDPTPGTGALIGEVHANILKALNCHAVATNGAVRDIAEVARIGFSMFAARLSVSHAYSHIVEAGSPVELGGLGVSPGDLLHGDCHGIISVPREHLSRLLTISSELRVQEADLLRLCHSANFSLERLRQAIRLTRREPR
jgi:regulator of RNase E activity RraA